MRKDIQKEHYYFEQRNSDKIYVSKTFPFFYFNFGNEKRYVKKVFEKENISEFFEVKGEILLRDLMVGKYQVSATVYTKDGNSLMEFILQRFTKDENNKLRPIKDTSFSFTQDEFTDLLKFLSDLKFLDFSNKDRFVVDGNSIPNNRILLNLTKPDPNKVFVDKNLGDLVTKLTALKENEREQLLKTLKNGVFSKSDLDILTGRRDGLEEFKLKLNNSSQIDEPEWQSFFKNNSWIFGYGLDYKFLNILQKEASVSSVDLDGKNEVKADFLLADNNFTVIVELKRPDTPLFEKDKNRSESWKLSRDLTYAISQILSQKAEWEFHSQNKNFDELGNAIIQTTIDPKTILIIGDTKQFKGNTKTDLIKRKTFELYRRNSRNIEIITYDELLDRAKFIVNDNNDEENYSSKDDEELPF
ncbi:Shedu immune nuclease family protein [Arcicella lustrica]|uniref:Shedu immune nuclease family protein n=1 Tax=Arcicella lustrica TaxID=2984196 RepID=A0ABU5SCN8_9BACT|nr:Shedu immune nuclease family protein [Arcicella sp. DC25W]MEA5425058.1 Shedu immune nuclease family protein [Arcicella sp. DC25W]